VQTVALAARQVADALRLVRAAEVEPGAVRARGDAAPAEVYFVCTLADLLDHAPARAKQGTWQSDMYRSYLT
jgi:hypothetical protein